MKYCTFWAGQNELDEKMNDHAELGWRLNRIIHAPLDETDGQPFLVVMELSSQNEIK